MFEPAQINLTPPRVRTLVTKLYLKRVGLLPFMHSLAGRLPSLAQTSFNNVTTPGDSKTFLVSIQRYDNKRWETSKTSTLRLLDSNLNEIGTKKVLGDVLGEEVSTYQNRSDPLKLNAVTAGNVLMFDAVVSKVKNL